MFFFLVLFLELPKLAYPPHSIIFWSDYLNDTQALAKHLKFLDENDAEYEKYRAWIRGSPRPQDFIDFWKVRSSVSAPCRLCEAVANRKYRATETYNGEILA